MSTIEAVDLIFKDEQKTIELKRAENLKLISESGLVDFLENEFPGCSIILFGSYSRGDDTTNSDIDIAVIGTKGKKIKLTKFDKLLGLNLYSLAMFQDLQVFGSFCSYCYKQWQPTFQNPQIPHEIM